MMRLKLVGANRASYKGAPKITTFGNTVDVDDNLGRHLLKQRAYSKSMGQRPLWQLVEDTDGDSAVTLADEPELNEELDANGEDPNEGLDLTDFDEDEEEETPPPAPKRKVAPKKKAPVKKARARKPAAK